MSLECKVHNQGPRDGDEVLCAQYALKRWKRYRKAILHLRSRSLALTLGGHGLSSAIPSVAAEVSRPPSLAAQTAG